MLPRQSLECSFRDCLELLYVLLNSVLTKSATTTVVSCGHGPIGTMGYVVPACSLVNAPLQAEHVPLDAFPGERVPVFTIPVGMCHKT